MKCRNTEKQKVQHFVACLAAATCVFLFVSSNALAQLIPRDDTNQVFVDFSVLGDSGVGQPPNPQVGAYLPSLSGKTLDPPINMPVSRLLATRLPDKSIAAKVVQSNVKLIPPREFKKPRARSQRKTVEKKNQKLTLKPRARSKLSAKPKPSKQKALAKLRPTSLAKPKPQAKVVKSPPPSSTTPTPPPKPKIALPSKVKKVKRRQVESLATKSESEQQASLLTSTRSGKPVDVVFAPESSNLSTNAQKNLDGMAAKLNSNKSIRMQLMAYAGERSMSASKARRLSLSRALAVRSYLIKKGVRGTRIDVRALGNKVPSGLPNKVRLRVIGQ